MAHRPRTHASAQTRPVPSAGTARRRSGPQPEGPRTLRPESAVRLRVSAADAHRLRSLLLSHEVGLIGSQDIRKLVTILEDVYPAQRQRRPHWQVILLGMGIGLAIIAGLLLPG
jgi:hypothetical protein